MFSSLYNARLLGSKKAQIASYDIAIAIAVFTLIFGTFAFYYNNNLEIFHNELKLREMRAMSEQALEVLLVSKGIPEDWSISDVNVIGLASKPYVIDEKKFSMLQSLPYATMKEKLLFGKYHFLLEFKNKAETITIGQQPQDTNHLRVRITALVNKSGVGTNVEFIVYE